MQTRGVTAKEITPIQKLLIGLPEGNNHCFFNEVGEVAALSAPAAAIALFNQAVNCPSFGGGFKGGLRGGAPITTLVDGPDLRQQVWRNVLTRERAEGNLPAWTHDLSRDRPTWVDPIEEKQKIHWDEIGLARGLFWQPAHVELVASKESSPCDLLGIDAGPVYKGFRKEKFNYQLEGTWPHPHGALSISAKKGEPDRFASFTTSAPAWTRLTELVIQKTSGSKGGNRPAVPVTQAGWLPLRPLHLVVGGYHNKQASVLERRHELISLAAGWDDTEGRLEELVWLGLETRRALWYKLNFVVIGKKDKGLKGIAVPIQKTGEKLFYAQTEALILDVFCDEVTFEQWRERCSAYLDALAEHCRRIFKELTEPYAMKPEFIPIIAWARRSLDADLSKLQPRSQ
jgi:CRISPR system Cascade subunit CasA